MIFGKRPAILCLALVVLLSATCSVSARVLRSDSAFLKQESVPALRTLLADSTDVKETEEEKELVDELMKEIEAEEDYDYDYDGEEEEDAKDDDDVDEKSDGVDIASADEVTKTVQSTDKETTSAKEAEGKNDNTDKEKASYSAEEDTTAEDDDEEKKDDEKASSTSEDDDNKEAESPEDDSDLTKGSEMNSTSVDAADPSSSGDDDGIIFGFGIVALTAMAAFVAVLVGGIFWYKKKRSRAAADVFAENPKYSAVVAGGVPVAGQQQGLINNSAGASQNWQQGRLK